MTTWVLLIIIWGSQSVTSQQITFKTATECELVSKQIKEVKNTLSFAHREAFCIQVLK